MAEKPEITGESRDEKGRFIPGVSGNPSGRPEGSVSIVEALRRKLKEAPEGKEKTYLEYFIEQVMKKTIIEGDVQMMRDLINRIDGMPKEEIGLTGNISIEIVNYAKNNNTEQLPAERISTAAPECD